METFVVRVWVPGDGEDAHGGDALHGFVEHVRSGGAEAFGNVDELAASLSTFLRACPRAPRRAPADLVSGRERIEIRS